jgi:hypothetical protein
MNIKRFLYWEKFLFTTQNLLKNFLFLIISKILIIIDLLVCSFLLIILFFAKKKNYLIIVNKKYQDPLNKNKFYLQDYDDFFGDIFKSYFLKKKISFNLFEYFLDEKFFIFQQSKQILFIFKKEIKYIHLYDYSLNEDNFQHINFYFLFFLKKFFGYKIIFTRTDTVEKNYENNYYKILNLSDVITRHELLKKFSCSKLNRKLILYPYVFDYNKLNKKYKLSKLKRDLDVVFIGSVGSYRSYRFEFIKFLLENNISVYFLPGRNSDCYLNTYEYWNKVGRAKIGLDLSKIIYTGRFFQLLASKTFVLKLKNSHTAKKFRNKKEIVEFNNKKDLLKKIKFYLKNYKIRNKIAHDGHKTYRKYNYENFINKIFFNLKAL